MEEASDAQKMKRERRKSHEQREDYTMKLAVVGESGVGKTSIIRRFTESRHQQAETPTIGVDLKVRTLAVGSKRVKLQIWDTAGEEQFRIGSHACFKSAMGVLLVYDVTSADSFANVKRWLSDSKGTAREEVVRLLVGNKCDMDGTRVVPTEEGAKLAASYGMEYVELSARAETNVEWAFAAVAKAVLDRIEQTQRMWDALNPADVVNLDVGGVHMRVGRATLCRHPDSLLARLFHKDGPLRVGKDGFAFIDRDPKAFALVIDYLRLGKLPRGLTDRELQMLKAEGRAWALAPLLQALSDRRTSSGSITSNVYNTLAPPAAAPSGSSRPAPRRGKSEAGNTTAAAATSAVVVKTVPHEGFEGAMRLPELTLAHDGSLDSHAGDEVEGGLQKEAVQPVAKELDMQFPFSSATVSRAESAITVASSTSTVIHNSTAAPGRLLLPHGRFNTGSPRTVGWADQVHVQKVHAQDSGSIVSLASGVSSHAPVHSLHTTSALSSAVPTVPSPVVWAGGRLTEEHRSGSAAALYRSVTAGGSNADWDTQASRRRSVPAAMVFGASTEGDHGATPVLLSGSHTSTALVPSAGVAPSATTSATAITASEENAHASSKIPSKTGSSLAYAAPASATTTARATTSTMSTAIPAIFTAEEAAEMASGSHPLARRVLTAHDVGSGAPTPVLPAYSAPSSATFHTTASANV